MNARLGPCSVIYGIGLLDPVLLFHLAATKKTSSARKVPRDVGKNRPKNGHAEKQNPTSALTSTRQGTAYKQTRYPLLAS